MRCPFCGNEETQVKDSRPSEDNAAIRRRRSCPECGQRFTTFERVQLREMTVVKAGNRRQPFDRDKIIRSMQVALRKRPVEIEEIEQAANKIVRYLESQGETEVASETIGEQVMKALIELDVVGYIRFASVYKDFRKPEDFNAFLDELKRLDMQPRQPRKKAS
ncbi:MAG: transcriptional repressor NrdR [Rhodospirillales bacterium]|nr:transcriptional repressor NrdR [Alphaproteobacteria bacterium]MCB1839717.1 transcriptional repressor NrdR [Alphaproteobacteria bacterium]MCB9976020.1 transcriptional repressor NrdR [Rhodospirillales bacterium]